MKTIKCRISQAAYLMMTAHAADDGICLNVPAKELPDGRMEVDLALSTFANFAQIAPPDLSESFIIASTK